jgi:hypothetical protein
MWRLSQDTWRLWPGYMEAHPENAGLKLELLTLVGAIDTSRYENAHPEAMQSHAETLMVLF